MHPIDEIEKITGSPARSLTGALADSGNPDVAACPDSISEVVAAFYALSECGRLFHWRFGEVREVSDRGVGYFAIEVQGARWEIKARTLQDRLFPDRPIEARGAIDWSTYGPDGPIPGVDDPLSERQLPGDTRVIRETPDRESYDRAHRLFYGD